MRGKGATSYYTMIPTRITPAHAGKSIRPIRPNKRKRDHPRPCGEKAPDMLGVTVAAGSPPPMRGKVIDQMVHDRIPGITPAHAGKS